MRAFVLHDELNNNYFNVNVIDTPGLNEARIDDMESRPDEEIIKLARHCISNQITYLNVVIYVAVAGKAHQLDIEAFKNIKNFLGNEFSRNSLMVLSHCDEITEKKFQQIVADMNKYEKTKEMIEYCKLGVLPYGTMSADKLDVLDDDEETPEQVQENKCIVIEKTLKRIAKMRLNLFNKMIETADMPNYISQLNGCIQYIETEKKKALDTALGEKQDEWDKELKEEINKFSEEYNSIQNKVEKRYENEFKKALDFQYNQYQKELKKQIDEEKKEYEKQLDNERRQQREEYRKNLLILIKDEHERQEKERLYAEQQARQAEERGRIQQQEMEKQRQERERIFREQLEKETEERVQRLATERRNEMLHELAQREQRIREEAERKKKEKSCIVM